MKQLPDLKREASRLRAIPWASATALTPEADALAREHVALMRDVLEHRAAQTGDTQLEAYADAQSAGYQADGYRDFLELVLTNVDYRQAPAREPLALTLISHYFWERDPDMGHLPDPWAPLVRLYELGYTSTFEQDDLEGSLDVVVEYVGGSRTYPLVSGEQGAD